MKYVLMLLLGMFLISCSTPTYDEEYVAIDGIYDAELVQEFVSFEALIQYTGRNEVMMEALWDGYEWENVYAAVDHYHSYANINIPHQWIYGDTQIWGNGRYENGFLTINYTIEWYGKQWYYTIEGF